MGFKRRYARGIRPELFRFRKGVWQHKHEQHWYYHPVKRAHRVRNEGAVLSLFEGCIVKTTYDCERLISNSIRSRIGYIREVRPVAWGHVADVVLSTGEMRSFDVRNLEWCGSAWYGRALMERIARHKEERKSKLSRAEKIGTEAHVCGKQAERICVHEHCACGKFETKESGGKGTVKATTQIIADDGFQIVSGQKSIIMSRDEAPTIGVVDICTPAGEYCGQAELRECVMPNRMVYSCLSKNAVNNIPYELFNVYFWIFKTLEKFYEGDHVGIRGESATGIITAIDGAKATVETSSGAKTVMLEELTLATHKDEPSA